MQSESIGSLAAALAKAQLEMGKAQKSSSNPFFKSKYADLSEVWDTCHKTLNENKLAVIQTTNRDTEGVTVVTTLAHESGEWISGELFMRPVKNDPQGVGSCITYARRYALAAMVGVVQEDDDGNAATHDKQQAKAAPTQAAKDAANKLKGAKENGLVSPELDKEMVNLWQTGQFDLFVEQYKAFEASLDA